MLAVLARQLYWRHAHSDPASQVDRDARTISACREVFPPKLSSPEPAADKGPCGRSSLVASSPSVAPRARLAGGVSGGLIDKGEIMAPVVWFLKSLGGIDKLSGLWQLDYRAPSHAVLSHHGMAIQTLVVRVYRTVLPPQDRNGGVQPLYLQSPKLFLCMTMHESRGFTSQLLTINMISGSPIYGKCFSGYTSRGLRF